MTYDPQAAGLRQEIWNLLLLAAERGRVPNGTTGALSLLDQYDNEIECEIRATGQKWKDWATGLSRDTTTDFPALERGN